MYNVHVYNTLLLPETVSNRKSQDSLLRYDVHSKYQENEENVLSFHFHGFVGKNSSHSKKYSCHC